MRLTEKQLRQMISDIIAEALPPVQANRATMNQVKTQGPLKDFVSHLNMAKADLGQLFQDINDPKAEQQAQALLGGVNRLITALEHMPELTRDPWHGVSRRD